MERRGCCCRGGLARGRRARRPRQPAFARGQRHRDEGPEGEGVVIGRQRRNQGQEHPPDRGLRRTQHRLQDRRHRRDEPEIGIREEGVRRGPASSLSGWSAILIGTVEAWTGRSTGEERYSSAGPGNVRRRRWVSRQTSFTKRASLVTCRMIKRIIAAGPL